MGGVTLYRLSLKAALIFSASRALVPLVFSQLSEGFSILARRPESQLYPFCWYLD